MSNLKNVAEGASLYLTGLGSLYCLSNSVYTFKEAVQGSQDPKQRNSRIIQRHISHVFGDADSKASCVVRDLFEASLWTVNAIGLGMLSLQFAQFQKSSSLGIFASRSLQVEEASSTVISSVISKVSYFVPNFLKDPYFLIPAVAMFGGTTLVNRIKVLLVSLQEHNDPFTTPAASPSRSKAGLGLTPNSPFPEWLRNTPRSVRQEVTDSPFGRLVSNLPRLTTDATRRVRGLVPETNIRLRLQELFKAGLKGEG